MGVLVCSVDVLVVVVLVVVVEVVVELVGANKAKQKEGAMGEVGFGPCTIGLVRQLC